MANRQPTPQVDPLPQRRWTVDEYHHMIAAVQQVLGVTDAIAPLAFPEISIQLATLFG